jgi:FkbM family methyltransferase
MINRLISFVEKSVQWIPYRAKILFKILKLDSIYSNFYRKLLTLGTEEVVQTPWGPKIWCDYSHWVERLIALGAFERRYIDYFSSHISEGDVVIDAGAFIGIFSLIAADRVGESGLVLAFEPNPSTFTRLKKNIKLNEYNNINYYEMALSDRSGTRGLLITREPGQSTFADENFTSIWHHDLVNSREKKRTEVRTISFDDFCKDHEILSVDAIKIDVEGFELKVLAGMKNIITNSPEISLFIEIHPRLMESLGGTQSQLFDLLADYGFTHFTLIESNRVFEIQEYDKVKLLQTTERDHLHVYRKRC